MGCIQALCELFNYLLVFQCFTQGHRSSNTKDLEVFDVVLEELLDDRRP
jgi:hypothetical protein